jgi:16S rRNA (guanine527-N7)-methyltransferase
MITFSPDIEAKLRIYQSLLLKWQRSVNLISSNTIDNNWERHFIDSAQLATLITKTNPVVVDIGSGGGFPGMVLAMMLSGSFHLVESDQKKCIFLSEVSRETKTNVVIHNDRVERSSFTHVDYITSRACSNVSQLFELTKNFVSHETKCLFLKGKNYRIEIDEAKKLWHFDVEIFPSITEKESAILVFSKARRIE